MTTTTTTLPDRPPPSTASYILATFIVAACAGYFLGQASSIGLFSSPSSSSSSSSSPRSKTSKSKKSLKNSKSSWPNSYDVTVHPDSSDEELMRGLRGKKENGGVGDSEDGDGDSGGRSGSGDESGDESEDLGGRGHEGLQAFEGNREECKLVLVVRTDLGMGKGKIAAQCSHATLACYKSLLSFTSTSSSPSSPFLPHQSSPSSLLKRWESSGQPKIALQVPDEEQLLLLRAKAVSVGLCAEVIRDAGRTQVVSGSVTVLGVGPGPRGVVDGVTGGLRLL